MNKIVGNNRHGAWQEWDKPANLLIEGFYFRGKKYGLQIDDDYGSYVNGMVSKEVKAHLVKAIEKLGEVITVANNSMNKFVALKSTPIQNLQGNNPSQGFEKKTPMNVIALKYMYLKTADLHSGITVKNRDGIAQSYGWNSKNSGRVLDRSFKLFYTTEDRIVIDREALNYRLLKHNRIELIERVIRELVKYPEALKIAEEELRRLTIGKLL